MRAVDWVAAGLALCGSAYACGGASDAFVSQSSDGGIDGTAASGGDAQNLSDAGAGNTATGDDAGRGGPGGGAGGDASNGADGPATVTRDGATTTSVDGATAPIDGATAAGPDAAPVDDGAAPDGAVGGRIACGAATCETSTQFCCAELDGGATCQTSQQACTALAGVPRQCEKTADCPANNVCCYELSSIPATSSCHENDCNGGNGMRVEACRSQGDCTTGTCAIHTCTAGGSIQACAPFAPECP